MKAETENNKIKYWLLTTHIYGDLLAEREIKTVKKHFKSGLAFRDPDFPISEWDILLYQDNLTLNLLRGSRLNPQL